MLFLPKWINGCYAENILSEVVLKQYCFDVTTCWYVGYMHKHSLCKKNFTFFLKIGKGVPLERMWQMHQVGTVPPHLVPSAQDAFDMYQASGGQLQLESSFGQDPLANNSQKVNTRNKQFSRFFPSFQDIFHDVVHGNVESFRSGLLYYIRLTEMLE